jgi:hypothetical protein
VHLTTGLCRPRRRYGLDLQLENRCARVDSELHVARARVRARQPAMRPQASTPEPRRAGQNWAGAATASPATPMTAIRTGTKLKVADKAIDKLKDRVRGLPVVHEATV